MLSKMSKIYEVVVFTASDQAYADSILDRIDKEKVWIHHRLYRENCAEYANNVYIKDLRVLGRDMRNVIIVDNAAYAFALQLENGYPITPFYNCKEDDEIYKLSQYLEKIQNSDDIQAENRMKFKLTKLLEMDIGKFIQYYHPGTTDVVSNESVPTLNDEDPGISKNITSALVSYQKELDILYGKKN